MLLVDAATWFLGELRTDGYPRTTVRTYRRILRSLCRFATARGVLHVTDCTPELLDAVAAALRQPGRHPANWHGGGASATLLRMTVRSLARRLAADGLPLPALQRARVNA